MLLPATARMIRTSYWFLSCGRRTGQQCFLSGLRLVDDSAVFCHDVIEQVDVGKDREKILQPPAGDKDRATAGHPKALD
jgi:hypothetical protein